MTFAIDHIIVCMCKKIFGRNFTSSASSIQCYCYTFWKLNVEYLVNRKPNTVKVTKRRAIDSQNAITVEYSGCQGIWVEDNNGKLEEKQPFSKIDTSKATGLVICGR